MQNQVRSSLFNQSERVWLRKSEFPKQCIHFFFFIKKSPRITENFLTWIRPLKGKVANPKWWLFPLLLMVNATFLLCFRSSPEESLVAGTNLADFIFFSQPVFLKALHPAHTGMQCPPSSPHFFFLTSQIFDLWIIYSWWFLSCSK